MKNLLSLHVFTKETKFRFFKFKFFFGAFSHKITCCAQRRAERGRIMGKIFFSSLFIHQLRSGEVMLCQILGSPAWLGYRKYRLCNVRTSAEVRL